MPLSVIDRDKDPDLFRYVTDRNLLRQYDFLADKVGVALANSQRIDLEALFQLNYYAVVFLCDKPGRFRTADVSITHSKHQPPPAAQVPQLIEEMLDYLNLHWDSASAGHLAGYALWRINWIHPFEEGNGRTARAVCLMLLCLKYQCWIPGREIIPKQIRDNRAPYYEVLHNADDHYAKTNGGVDVAAVEAYLNALLRIQVTS